MRQNQHSKTTTPLYNPPFTQAMSYSGNRVFRGKRAGSLRQNVGRQIRQARKEKPLLFLVFPSLYQ